MRPARPGDLLSVGHRVARVTSPPSTSTRDPAGVRPEASPCSRTGPGVPRCDLGERARSGGRWARICGGLHADAAASPCARPQGVRRVPAGRSASPGCQGARCGRAGLARSGAARRRCRDGHRWRPAGGRGPGATASAVIVTASAAAATVSSVDLRVVPGAERPPSRWRTRTVVGPVVSVRVGGHAGFVVQPPADRAYKRSRLRRVDATDQQHERQQHPDRDRQEQTCGQAEGRGGDRDRELGTVDVPEPNDSPMSTRPTTATTTIEASTACGRSSSTGAEEDRDQDGEQGSRQACNLAASPGADVHRALREAAGGGRVGLKPPSTDVIPTASSSWSLSTSGSCRRRSCGRRARSPGTT